MNNTIERPAEPLTLEGLHSELIELRQRVEDPEDLRDLEDAITQNAGKQLLPWESVKKDLELE